MNEIDVARAAGTLFALSRSARKRLPPRFDVNRWWLAKGDTLWRAEEFGQPPLVATLVSDDGVGWVVNVDGVRTEPPSESSIWWDYVAKDAKGPGLGLLTSEQQRQLTDALTARSRRPRERLSELEVGLLDALADAPLNKQYLLVRELRHQFKAFGKNAVNEALACLSPRYTESRGWKPDEVSELTILGLLESSRRDEVKRFIEGALIALARVYDRDPALRELPWKEVVQAAGADERQHRFADWVFRRARLLGEARHRDDDWFWEVPHDVEDLAEITTFDEFTKYCRNETTTRPWPTCPTILEGEQELSSETPLRVFHEAREEADQMEAAGDDLGASAAETDQVEPRNADEPLRVFYSWQDGPDNKANRNLIGDALKRAIQALRREGIIDQRIVIEQDARGAAGSPDIRNELLAKIERSDAFVADVTFAGTLEGGDPTPNPNVLFELGYAWKHLGEKRIVMVLNEESGSPRKMPFDITRHLLQTYKYKSNNGDPGQARASLIGKLKAALGAILADAAGPSKDG